MARPTEQPKSQTEDQGADDQADGQAARIRQNVRRNQLHDKSSLTSKEVYCLRSDEGNERPRTCQERAAFLSMLIPWRLPYNVCDRNKMGNDFWSIMDLKDGSLDAQVALGA